jgi:hypothetical protein
VEFPRAPGLHIGVIFYELQAPLNEHSKIGKPNGVIGERTPYFVNIALANSNYLEQLRRWRRKRGQHSRDFGRELNGVGDGNYSRRLRSQQSPRPLSPPTSAQGGGLDGDFAGYD